MVVKESGQEAVNFGNLSGDEYVSSLCRNCCSIIVTLTVAGPPMFIMTTAANKVESSLAGVSEYQLVTPS